MAENLHKGDLMPRMGRADGPFALPGFLAALVPKLWHSCRHTFLSVCPDTFPLPAFLAFWRFGVFEANAQNKGFWGRAANPGGFPIQKIPIFPLKIRKNHINFTFHKFITFKSVPYGVK